MALTTTIQSAFVRYQQEIYTTLRRAVQMALQDTQSTSVNLTPYYGMMQYHLGWVDAELAPFHNNTGKLLRPILLLLAYEAAGVWNGERTEGSDYLQRALPAAAAVELVHNFSLIHDDIEDGDTERRHRATLWKQWGVAQAINAGDGMFSLARFTLWEVLEQGVEGSIAARLGRLLDRACLELAEGQYLDISFEQRLDISVAMYIDMISRKTAALMRCSAEMGAYLGTRDTETIQRLSSFGEAIGIAFQVRDDLLGVWASTAELGKTPAGDVYRRKKSLPVLHALEQASEQDQQHLRTLYQQETPLTEEQVEQVLAIFARTSTRDYCRHFLTQQCQQAYTALANVPHLQMTGAIRALEDLHALVDFVVETANS